MAVWKHILVLSLTILVLIIGTSNGLRKCFDPDFNESFHNNCKDCLNRGCQWHNSLEECFANSNFTQNRITNIKDCPKPFIFVEKRSNGLPVYVYLIIGAVFAGTVIGLTYSKRKRQNMTNNRNMPAIRYVPSGGNQINSNVTYDRGIRTSTDFRGPSNPDSAIFGSHAISLGENPPTYEEAVHHSTFCDK